jgi:polyisoprenoid-binding protein YceI
LKYFREVRGFVIFVAGEQSGFGEDVPYMTAPMVTRLVIAAAFVFVAAPGPIRARAAIEVYQIDAAKSRVAIAVGKAGAFSFIAGHTHEVTGPIESGRIDLDPDDPSRSQIRIVIGASALKVTGAKEPPDDRPKVQEAMESDKVLDVARYPRITFESTGVTTKRRDAATLDVLVAGRLTIRDTTRPVTVPVRVELGSRELTATGRFSIEQTAFGIKPISVAGLVTVKDALDISFSITSRR